MLRFQYLLVFHGRPGDDHRYHHPCSAYKDGLRTSIVQEEQDRFIRNFSLGRIVCDGSSGTTIAKLTFSSVSYSLVSFEWRTHTIPAPKMVSVVLPLCLSSPSLRSLANTDLQVAFTGAELWASVHVGTGIICACLPTYRPLLAKTANTASSLRERYHNKSWTWHSRSMKSGHSTALPPPLVPSSRFNDPHLPGFSRNSLHGRNDSAHHTFCHSGSSNGSVQKDDIPDAYHLDRIHVRSTVEVV
jgi:hypothetical protein